jgi:hypothetical protein
MRLLARHEHEPTIGMAGLAVRLAASLQRGRYIADPALAAEVHAVWFASLQCRATAEEVASAMEVVDSFETPESLASIVNETRALLQEASR